MKFARILFSLVILGSLAVAAHAQTSVDPIIYTKLGPDPACGGAGEPICLASNTLTVDYSTATFPISFVNNSGSSFDSFTLVFDDVPDGTSLECLTNIWGNCTFSATASTTGFETWTFTMDDFFGETPITAPNCDANDGGGNVCPGFLGAGDEATTYSMPSVNDTPEPESIYLFGTGLILLVIGLKKAALPPART